MKKGMRFFVSGWTAILLSSAPVHVRADNATLTPEQNAVLQRWETVSKAVDEKIASLPRDKASRQLVAPEIYEFLKSRSEVENVGISAEKDAVWATVKGGGKIAFLNNRFPDTAK